MSRYTMKKGEAIKYINDFEKYMEEKRNIVLKPMEKIRLRRFIYWLYEEEGWTISREE